MTEDGLSPGDVLAERYRLIDRIGSGGMSVIWRAHDETLDRLVAVKVLDLALSGDERLRELAKREAWAVARLNHPDVASVHDFVRDTTPDGDEIAVIVLQLVAGEPLADRIAMGPLTWQEALRIASRVAAVLDVAHRRAVVHRDITPDNIMLHGEQVTVLDFGIAARIGEPDDDSTGASFGTPAYVAPERLDGTPTRAATDIYAFGVVVYEMLTGGPPFAVRGWQDVAADHGQPPELAVPGLPRTIGPLLRRCLDRDPAKRPEAAEIVQIIEAARRQTAPARWLWPAVAGVFAAVALLVLAWSLPLDGDKDPGQLADPGAASASPTPQTSVSPEPSGSPSPSASPPAVTPGPSAPPSPSPPGSSPKPSPTVLSVDEALGAAMITIDEASADGTIRDDVAVDLRQLLRNLAYRQDDPQTLSTEVDEVRRKITDREREGSLAPAVARQLRSDLDALAKALAA